MENEHVSLEGEQVRMFMSCPMCGTDHLVILTLDQYQRFLDSRIKGMYIQTALPDVDPATRELLITGICPACFSIL